MASFPRPAYFRLKENRKRKPIRYDPDYPLVLFVFFSRWSAGVAVAAGVLQIRSENGPLVTVSMIVALTLILGATVSSLFHLSDRMRFLAMMKNLRSQVSQEILIAGGFMVAVAVECVVLFFFDSPPVVRIVVACGVIVSGLLTVAATGWAYKFSSHPYWNTNILSGYYLASCLVLGLSTLQVLSDFSLRPSAMSRELAGGSIASLIVVHVIIGCSFLVRITRRSFGALGLFNTKNAQRALRLYAISMCFSFVFAIGVSSLDRWEGIVSTMLLISLLANVLSERILFFRIESPHYLFKILGEGEYV